ncbi:iron-sulfur cluster biosynthesis family protein [Enterococcus saccharolyticus]|uniref:Core domain-containing protein n=1 Tax=Enterococcus saccharolyticus subsp. saccharolyticus ATCC 43076 TaxID=1139996 RepID=S0JEZ6_9ENTE|nr:iron-sulfur cluster biosynthesis family protein [Enterococcus saccharolyticus]EOT25601.1 hypothetical protein OMQ_02488 [Enterococcus saccharolyticus subsp. saccharolyticus ATCC 43076]EOT83289.1 hypothetical protein I572_00158 [Enterococcus saccharolyticus subsp. saccharolyticus ATCC 43076]OJG90632.1 hypothetical protein RV16_GL001581 [Enterococcus saccharolyticus]
MKLSLTKEAQEKINGIRQAGDRIVLDFEDAIGPFVESGASCQLYPNFRVLFVPKEFPEAELVDYDDHLTTELGTVYVKSTSERYLDQETRLSVEPTYQRVQLVSDSGVLAANVPMKRIELKEGKTDAQISNRYGSSC